ncbi:hypothetical protein [Dysgonomonas alginatilytica]|nr:hypothetical protein [Dysgonomonas alginatilytica]
MKNINFLLISIITIMICFSLNSCSKDDDTQEPMGTIRVGGNDHKIVEAGYTTWPENDITCIQFIIEDSEATYNQSHIEIKMPTTLTGNWFTLTQDNPNWSVILRNFYVGDGTNMNNISEGRVRIKQLGNNDKENKCKFQVSFEITLTDGTTAVADIQAKFLNSSLWVGGR